MVQSIAAFDFDLPRDRIAHSPVRPRDAARMLCVRPGQSFEDSVVRELPGILRKGDILVANDTRVIPAQLTAWRGNARVGITLDQPRADGSWHALARGARRLREGESLRFDGDERLNARIVARHRDGGVTLRFNLEGEDFTRSLLQAGMLALPPYIDRPYGPEFSDSADYQTVFALHDGAVAAPTAGLHFTPALLEALRSGGIAQATVTLHVGAGTFLPVRTDNPTQHRMHSERGEITAEAASRINAAREQGGRIIAVGTSTLRLLESAVGEDGKVRPFAGETSLFILPGFRFRAADLLATNFHLPQSTLFMLVCAFAGSNTMRAAYAHAIADGYRFYSYGDMSLLWRDDL